MRVLKLTKKAIMARAKYAMTPYQYDETLPLNILLRRISNARKRRQKQEYVESIMFSQSINFIDTDIDDLLFHTLRI